MKLKSLLEKKASQFKEGTQEYEVAEWLNHKAGEIKTLASSHLKLVNKVFDEFDVHDAEHSENVLTIIENLLGDEAKNLSSYDLFSLIAVSYLHDCGMAVSDYEMRVMDLTEKEEFDGIKSKPSEAKDTIKNYKDLICGKRSTDFEGEIRNWLFVPEKKEDLIDYLAKLFLDYQDYRNGKREVIKKSDNLEQTNRDERLNYLRLTHHERVKTYIRNWGSSIFKDFPGGNGQKLADTIAQCCLAHGKSKSYIEKDLKELTDVMYYGSETSNLQFISIMLRLGDLIDYNCKRAHPVLRALHQFKSDFSFDQWRIKDENALSFSVKNGKIACVATCKMPRDYYRICSYVNQIDDELELYVKLRDENEWNDYPNSLSEKVNRRNLSLDDRYDPVPGLRFVLDQKNVLKLLTGANLYPNKYACLRELYQNSLDACRCQIAKAKSVGIPLVGKILFGLGEEDGRKFVYCLDNGKGMSKDIIQKYVLHIGTSYYRSEEFSKEKAKNKADFTPTSQFGIGLLSCFMIGDEIVITTCEEGGELVSCGIDEPNECFYYINKPSDFDKELVSQFNSGTLVKIFLNEKYQELLNDDPLEKLGYLLWCDLRDEAIKHDMDRWEHHLYRIMNDFIIEVPDGIDVNIELQNPAGGKESIKIYNKPLPIIEELRPYANINNKIDDRFKSGFDKFKNMEYNVIQVQENGLECRTVIYFTETRSFGRYIDVNGEDRCCVDGIGISHLVSDESILYQLDGEVGTLNFIGENRPQLSVSREEIIGSSVSDYDNDARILLQKLCMESIKEVCAYIKDKGILPDNALYDTIWGKLFDKFIFCRSILYECLKEHIDCHDMQLPRISKAMSFGNLLIADETIIPKDMLTKHGYYDAIYFFFMFRLLESESIEVKDENSLMAKGHVGIPAFDSGFEEFDDDYLLNHPSGYNNFWKEHDFVRFASVRFISDNIWQNIRDNQNDKADENVYVFTESWIYSRQLYGIRKILSEFDYEINTRRRVDSLSDSFGFDLEATIGSFFYKKTNSYHQVEYLGLTTYTQDYSVLAVQEPESDELICFARHGKLTRKELLDSITGERREKIKNVLFPNGEVLSPQPVK